MRKIEPALQNWGEFVKQALESASHIEDANQPWDVNEDGETNILDLILVARHFGEKIAVSSYPNPDVNGDGEIDILDLALIAKHFGEIYFMSNN